MAAGQVSLSITNFWSLLKFMSTELVMLSNYSILYHPLLLLPSVFPSTRVFSNKSTLRFRWQKYWASASASVLAMNIQGWAPLRLICLISLQSKGLSRVFSSTTIWKHHLHITYGYFPATAAKLNSADWSQSKPLTYDPLRKKKNLLTPILQSGFSGDIVVNNPHANAGDSRDLGSIHG